MILVIHLIIGNFLFFLFLVKRDVILSYYSKCSRILKVNGCLKRGQNIPEPVESNEPSASKSSFFMTIFFYIQFITIAWMLFLTTFLAAEIVMRLNPKVKEYL